MSPSPHPQVTSNWPLPAEDSRQLQLKGEGKRRTEHLGLGRRIQSSWEHYRLLSKQNRNKILQNNKAHRCACKPPAQPEGISKCKTPASLVLERKLSKANVGQRVSLQNTGPGSHCSALLCMSPELARPSTTSTVCYLITSDCI